MKLFQKQPTHQATNTKSLLTAFLFATANLLGANNVLAADLVILDAPQETITKSYGKDTYEADLLVRDWYCDRPEITDEFNARFEKFFKIFKPKTCDAAKEYANFQRGMTTRSVDMLAVDLKLRSAQELIIGVRTSRSGPGGEEELPIRKDLEAVLVPVPSVTTLKHCFTAKDIRDIYEIRAREQEAHAKKVCDQEAKDNIDDPAELGDGDAVL